MEARPPYLFASDHFTGDAGGRPSLTVLGDVDAALVVITVHDEWTGRLRGDATIAIDKCFAERPVAVIIDVTRMADPRSTSVATWMAAARKGGSLEPPVQLVLCLPATMPLAARLKRLGAHLYLPMFDTMQHAREAIATRLPLTDALRLRLSAGPAAASVARDLVGDACQAWDLMHLLHAGRAVMSELVVNAFEHASNEIQVSLSRRGTGLHIAVRDNDPLLPRMIDLAPVVAGQPLDERGQGLHLVHASAATWGAMATKEGKVVWATVRPHNGRPHDQGPEHPGRTRSALPKMSVTADRFFSDRRHGGADPLR